MRSDYYLDYKEITVWKVSNKNLNRKEVKESLCKRIQFCDMLGKRIAEKQSAKEALAAEIASITANIDTLKADLKEKKSALKKAEKEVASLEAKKAKADAKAAEEAKKAEAEAVLKKLLASGMSADEILEKLK